MAKFQFNETLDQLAQIVTARVADGAGANNQVADADVDKFVKLAGDSRYGLCAVGDEIEGVLDSINGGPTQDGYTLGGVRKNGRVKVTLDGLQASLCVPNDGNRLCGARKRLPGAGGDEQTQVAPDL